jgi:hypothetical protein
MERGKLLIAKPTFLAFRFSFFVFAVKNVFLRLARKLDKVFTFFISNGMVAHFVLTLEQKRN